MFANPEGKTLDDILEDRRDELEGIKQIYADEIQFAKDRINNRKKITDASRLPFILSLNSPYEDYVKDYGRLIDYNSNILPAFFPYLEWNWSSYRKDNVSEKWEDCRRKNWNKKKNLYKININKEPLDKVNSFISIR